jgi:hypothetical protein
MTVDSLYIGKMSIGILTILIVHLIIGRVLVVHVPYVFGKRHKYPINKLKVNRLVAVVNQELVKVWHVTYPIIEHESQLLVHYAVQLLCDYVVSI